MKIRLSPDSWVVPALAVAMAVGYAALFFVPGHRRLNQMREDLEMKQAFVAQAGSLPAALATTQSELEKAVQYHQAWKETSPGRSKLSALHGQISALAKQIGITTTRFDPDPGQNMSRLCRIPLLIGCNGSFHQIVQFLQGIESLPPTIWVNKFRVGIDSKDGKTVQGEVSLEIFADNPDISDQVNRSEQPIKEETSRQGANRPIGSVAKP